MGYCCFLKYSYRNHVVVYYSLIQEIRYRYEVPCVRRKIVLSGDDELDIRVLLSSFRIPTLIRARLTFPLAIGHSEAFTLARTVRPRCHLMLLEDR